MNKINFLQPTKISKLGERYNNHPGPFYIEEEDLNNIFNGIKDIKSDVLLNHIKGDLDNNNLSIINRVVKYLNPSIIVEIGTYRGRTTYNLLKCTKQSKIATIDCDIDNISVFSGCDTNYFQKQSNIGKLYKDTPESNRVTQILSNSMSNECENQLDDFLNGQKIDFTFIDGGHNYDTIKHDFEELVLPRVTNDGIIILDDYARYKTHVGVTQFALEKSYYDGYVFYLVGGTNELIFINNYKGRNYNWKSVDCVE